MKFPDHKCALILTHNEHKNVYMTVAESIDQRSFAYCDWVSSEQKEKAIATNECWSLQWYPETPVGFCLLSAADLDVLLEAAKK